MKRIKNLLRRFFRTSTVSNERGSVLSVTLIVITVLTFTLTTVTSSNVNLAGSTTVQMEQVADDSLAKGLIRQAIDDFETFILDGGTFDEYDNTEIDNFEDVGVYIFNDSDSDDDYGDFGEYKSRIYKFTYPMPDGDILVKYVYVSNFGTDVEEYDAFDFSLATNGTLVLNSGYYIRTKNRRKWN